MTTCHCGRAIERGREYCSDLCEQYWNQQIAKATEQTLLGQVDQLRSAWRDLIHTILPTRKVTS